MNRIFNSLVNKITWILIILIVGLTCFFIGLNNAHALEVSDWTDSDTLLISEVDSSPYYTYDNYDPSVIMNNIYNWSNAQFFDSTYTIEEFYSIFTYVIYSVDESTVRAYVQNAPLVLDWQGISSTSNDITFYLSNVLGNVNNGSRYAYGVGIIYTYYIDINLDNLSYTISDNNPLLDVTMQKLTSITSGDTSSILNIKMLDSYNGNISWISTWNDLYNNSGLWRNISGYTGSLSVIYSTNPNAIISDFLYTSPGVTPVPPDEPETPPEEDDSVIAGLIDKTNKILEGIGGTVTNIYETITESFEDFSSIEEFFESFSESDIGGISSIVSLPLDLIRSLTDDNSCEPLILTIWGKEVHIPSGCIMWEQASDSVITVWHTVICGLGSYYILVDAFKTKEKLLDPHNREVKTLDL